MKLNVFDLFDHHQSEFYHFTFIGEMYIKAPDVLQFRRTGK